jgi:hypothetical protein
MNAGSVGEVRGRSRRSILLTILCLAIACPTTYFMGRWANPSLDRKSALVDPTPVLPAPGLSIDPAELNLGEIWEDPEFATTVSLRNTSDGAISVSRFGTSCDCSGIEPSTVVVPARSSVPLRVKMDLTHRRLHFSTLERRPFSLTVHPLVLQAGIVSNGWEFNGVIRSRVGLSDTRLEFGDQCTHDGPAFTRKVRATAFHGATLETVAQPKLAKVQLTPVAGKPGEYEIRITPDPKLPYGAFRFDVPITAVMPDGSRHRCAAIEVSGVMQPSTRVVPGIVLLGEHSVGDEATAEVSVRFPDASGWAVDRVVVESSHLTAIPNGAFEDGALRYRLVQRITEPGDRVNQVQFVVGKPGSAKESIEIKVRYHGGSASSR